MDEKITCLVLDDEPVGKEIIENYVKRVPFLDLIGAFEDPMEALELLQKTPVDLIFTDIEMPGISGLQLINALSYKPLAILITGFREHAIEGFESDVVDYLLKPVSFERFLKAVNKAQERLGSREKKNVSRDEFMFVKSDHQFVKILFKDVVYLEALKDYLKIHLLSGEKYLTYSTLKAMDQKLPDYFFRIHRTFIINTRYIKSFNGNTVQLSIGEPLPVSSNLKPKLFQRLGIEE